MFSTPQSKAFFSQEIVKGKLIAEQIQLINQIHQRIWEAKCMIQQVLKIPLNTNDQITIIEEKLILIQENIEQVFQIVSESNQLFSFEVSLRNDIKHLEHSFFKYILKLYEQKIKQLKQSLLLLEHEVQKLEQQGLLPYIQSPQKNNILSTKSKNYYEYKQKIQIIQAILKVSYQKKLQNLIIKIINNSINQQKKKKQEKIKQIQDSKPQDLNKSQQIQIPHQVSYSQSGKISQPQKSPKIPIQSISKQLKHKQLSLSDLVEILHKWLFIINGKIRNCNRLFKRKIQSLSVTNKTLKQGIRYFKRIMDFQQTQSMVRSGSIQLTREETIDFLRQMNQDLQQRFLKRNIYMIISGQFKKPQTKSCTNLKTPLILSKQSHRCLKQVNNNLNNSFLQQCSYLISDRFLADQDQNQQLIM